MPVMETFCLKLSGTTTKKNREKWVYAFPKGISAKVNKTLAGI